MFSLILFYYARRIDMAFPFTLYINQVGLALVKIYIVFRLPMQRWANRGDQRAGLSGGYMFAVKRAAADPPSARCPNNGRRCTCSTRSSSTKAGHLIA